MLQWIIHDTLFIHKIVERNSLLMKKLLIICPLNILESCMMKYPLWINTAHKCDLKIHVRYSSTINALILIHFMTIFWFTDQLTRPETRIYQINTWTIQMQQNWASLCRRMHDIIGLFGSYFWFKYDLGQKYYTPKVWPNQGSNS